MELGSKSNLLVLTLDIVINQFEPQFLHICNSFYNSVGQRLK